jgi:hypothetical protein
MYQLEYLRKRILEKEKEYLRKNFFSSSVLCAVILIGCVQFPPSLEMPLTMMSAKLEKP